MSEAMASMGFSWYGKASGGHWVFDPRLVDPATLAAQFEAAAEGRKQRCLKLARRRHCTAARRLKLLRRAKGAAEGNRGPNRHERRAARKRS